MGDKLATIITSGMATWRFIAFILAACILEIVSNQHGWVHFDPTMLVLNTILSLWAAVQGSIIMINQNLADAKRDKTMDTILEVEERIVARIDQLQEKQ